MKVWRIGELQAPWLVHQFLNQYFLISKALQSFTPARIQSLQEVGRATNDTHTLG